MFQNVEDNSLNYSETKNPPVEGGFFIVVTQLFKILKCNVNHCDTVFCTHRAVLLDTKIQI